MSERIVPSIPGHEELTADVWEFLRENGFLCYSAAYHDVAPPQIQEILKLRNSPTGLYIRTRADRLAIHKTVPIEFEWEAKTHVSRARNDMCLEALPLLHHKRKADLGVECLYVYRNTNPGHESECGFWVSNIPEIRCIMIPDRWSKKRAGWFQSIFASYFPDAEVISGISAAGSGDPFVVVGEETTHTLVHWRNLIKEITLKQESVRSVDHA